MRVFSPNQVLPLDFSHFITDLVQPAANHPSPTSSTFHKRNIAPTPKSCQNLIPPRLLKTTVAQLEIFFQTWSREEPLIKHKHIKTWFVITFIRGEILKSWLDLLRILSLNPRFLVRSLNILWPPWASNGIHVWIMKKVKGPKSIDSMLTPLLHLKPKQPQPTWHPFVSMSSGTQTTSSNFSLPARKLQ